MEIDRIQNIVLKYRETGKDKMRTLKNKKKDNNYWPSYITIAFSFIFLKKLAIVCSYAFDLLWSLENS